MVGSMSMELDIQNGRGIPHLQYSNNERPYALEPETIQIHVLVPGTLTGCCTNTDHEHCHAQ